MPEFRYHDQRRSATGRQLLLRSAGDRPAVWSPPSSHLPRQLAIGNDRPGEGYRANPDAQATASTLQDMAISIAFFLGHQQLRKAPSRDFLSACSLGGFMTRLIRSISALKPTKTAARPTSECIRRHQLRHFGHLRPFVTTANNQSDHLPRSGSSDSQPKARARPHQRGKNRNAPCRQCHTRPRVLRFPVLTQTPQARG